MKYKVQWNYTSSLGGPWMKGDLVELDEVLAARINLDSPGVLKPVKGPGKSQDRMVTEAQTRLPESPVGDRKKEEPITKEDFKAVRD